MTITSLITLNAVLGAVVLYSLLQLLAHGIRSDRVQERAAVRSLPQRDSRDIAA